MTLKEIQNIGENEPVRLKTDLADFPVYIRNIPSGKPKKCLVTLCRNEIKLYHNVPINRLFKIDGKIL